ncbi:enoyl-CoA hydratase/isomerase family protein, partial [Rhodococcus qingshengii]
MRPSRRDSGMVDVTFDGPIATVTIGTGRRRNALNGDAWKDLAHQIIGVSTHASLGVVVLRGVGDTFCAGSDVTEWVGACAEDVEESFAQMEAAFRAIEICPVPVIAQISGVAAGAGCQLALACDIRVVATSARIGMPIARLGIRPSPAFAARLVRVVG